MNEQINWDSLLLLLETGRCVLCVGPDAFSTDQDARIERTLANLLRQQSNALGIRVYDDGWFHYLDKHDETETWLTVKRFYETGLPTETSSVFEDVAALPFQLILNFSPDYRLCEAFKSVGKPFVFDSLDKTQNCRKADYEPTPAKPLLFNMLGEVNEKESLIMTYNDLFHYMEAIFEKKRLPDNVKTKLEKASYFIFLGMPLDKWYFHLFMRVLNMHKNLTKTKRYGATYAVNGENAAFCLEHYNLAFVQENIGGFVQQMKAKWEAAQAQKTGATYLSVFERWRAKVKTGEDVAIRQAFAEMKPYAKNSGDLSNALLLLEMQWNGFTSIVFETEMAKNAMKTQVLNGILQLIDRIEQLNPNPQP